MKLAVRILLAFLAVSAVAAACTLNPQPLPPDAPDGSFAAADGSSKGAALGGDDAMAAPPQDEADAGANSGSVPTDADAGSEDSGDGASVITDASDDANDAG